MSVTKKKSLLMICYLFPPIRASGVARSLAFAQHLKDFGWDVTVLTVKQSKDKWVVSDGEPEPEGMSIVRTFEFNISIILDTLFGITNRILGLFRTRLKRNWFRVIFAFPDIQIGWFASWRGILLARNADVIYCSCSPFSSALRGVLIKVFTRKPLVIDFRDAWLLNPYKNYFYWENKLIAWMEHCAIKHCDKLILNTEGALALYQKHYPKFKHKMTAIPNGFDCLNIPEQSEQNSEKFTIMHVGNFYGSRKPDLLLEAIQRIGNPDIEFVQVGMPFSSYEHYCKSTCIKMVETVSNEEALKLMRSASLLYLKQGWEHGVKNYIAVAAKTYEYLATGVPILAECPEGDNATIIKQYATQSYVITEESLDLVEKSLREAIKNRNSQHPSVSPELVNKFSRKSTTAMLNDTLDCL